MWIQITGRKEQIKQYIINKIKDRDDIDYGTVVNALNNDQHINQQCNPIPFIIFSKIGGVIHQKYQMIIDQQTWPLQFKQIRKKNNMHLYKIHSNQKVVFTWATQKQIIDYYGLLRGLMLDTQMINLTVTKYSSTKKIFTHTQLSKKVYNIKYSDTKQMTAIMDSDQIYIPQQCKYINQIAFIGNLFNYDKLYNMQANLWLYYDIEGDEF